MKRAPGVAVILLSMAIAIGGLPLIVAPAAQAAPGVPPVIQGEPSWAFLETRARAALSDIHGVANDDRLLRYARGEILALMATYLLDIIDRPASERTPAESAAMAALQARVDRLRRETAQGALEEYRLWAASPCRYVPPPGMTYDDRPSCSHLGDLWGPAPPPSAAAFSAWGAVRATPWVTSAPDTSRGLERGISLLTAGAVPTSAAAWAGHIIYVGEYAFIKNIALDLFPRALWKVAQQDLAAKAGAFMSGPVAFSVGVIVTGIIVMTLRGIDVAQGEETRQAVEAAAAAGSVPIPLSVMVEDGDGLGMISLALLEASLKTPTGELAPPSLPAPEPFNSTLSQATFETVNPDGSRLTGPTFTTFDIAGRRRESYVYDGWLVSQVDGAVTWSLSIDVFDSSYTVGLGPHNLTTAAVWVAHDRFTVVANPSPWTEGCATAAEADWPGLGDRCTSGLTFDSIDVGRYASAPSHPVMITTNWIADEPPVVERIDTEGRLVEGSPVGLTVAASDPEGGPLTVEWWISPPEDCHQCVLTTDFTDREPTHLMGEQVSHTFTDDGPHSVTVEVTDQNGGRSSLTRNVYVTNVAPAVAVTTPTLTADPGQPVTLSGAWVDPGSNDSHRLRIRWGDATESDITHPDPGGISLVTRDTPDGGEYDVSHTYEAAGTYHGRVVVMDDDLGTSFGQGFTVTVGDGTPPPEDATTPGAPTGVIAYRDSGEWRVVFEQEDDGGSPITGYQYANGTLDLGAPDGKAWFPVEGWDGEGQITLTGFPELWPASFEIRALNAVGPGPSSGNVQVVHDTHSLSPEIVLEGRAVIDEGETVFLDASGTTTFPDAGVASWAWDVGNDGTIDGDEPSLSIPDLPVGTETVTLAVVDTRGRVSVALHIISVRDRPATLTGFPTVIDGYAGFPVRIDGWIDDPGVTPIAATVTWDDGHEDQLTTAPGELHKSHVYAEPGSYLARVDIRDTTSAASRVVRVEITEPPPELLAPPDPEPEPEPDPGPDPVPEPGPEPAPADGDGPAAEADPGSAVPAAEDAAGPASVSQPGEGDGTEDSPATSDGDSPEDGTAAGTDATGGSSDASPNSGESAEDAMDETAAPDAGSSRSTDDGWGFITWLAVAMAGLAAAGLVGAVARSRLVGRRP